MSGPYLLVCNGKRYNSITLDEVRRILIDDCHYSCAYVQSMLNKANVDHSPATIEWVPGRNMNWIVDGVRMGRKCAIFALEWKGCSKEAAEVVLHANKLCKHAEDTIKEVHEACKQIDEEFQQWLLSVKSGSAPNAPSSAESARPSSARKSSAAERPRAEQP